MATVSDKLMTLEEFLALPDDMDRDLIRGRVLEQEMTNRNQVHSWIAARVGQLLFNWVDTQPRPWGRVYIGEAGFRLHEDPDSFVGIDVAYASPEVVAECRDTTYVNAPPLLAVEILSPSDKHEDVISKVGEYLSVGVPIVWVIDPYFRTVTVYRPNEIPQMRAGDEELNGDPHLPGFSVRVSRIFEE